MRVKTYRGLFWECVIAFIVINVVLCLAELAFAGGAQSVYDPTRWLVFELLKLIFCFMAGFMIRKRTDYTLFEADGSERKYMVIFFVCVVLSILFLVIHGLLAMPYVLATDKVYAATGLDFSYFDLWCFSACLGCAFLKVKPKEEKA